MSAAEDLYEIEVLEHAASFTARGSLAQIAAILAVDHLEHDMDIVQIKKARNDSNVVPIRTHDENIILDLYSGFPTMEDDLSP